MLVAAVIPAFAEENTITGVVQAVQKSPLVGEVIVVNDGSPDRTAAAAKGTGARVIDLPENRGKGGAIEAGCAATAAEVLLLLDADLIGLTPEHIDLLLAPVLAGEADMTVGVFGSGRFLTDLAQKLAPQLSGQRAVRREIVSSVPDLSAKRFGVEMALEDSARAAKARVAVVRLMNLSHMMKEEKLGFIPGFRARLRMYWEIFRYRREHRGVGEK